MTRHSIRTALFGALVLLASTLAATPVKVNLRITQNGSAARPADTKFRLWMTSGFSVVQKTGSYYFYGATHQRRAWKSSGADMWDLELNPNCGYDCNYSSSDPCNYTTDPWTRPTTGAPAYDARCGDSTGMWSISTNPSSTYWSFNNTSGGVTLIPPAPQVGTWPYQWPQNWQLTGAPGFKQTTDATKINAVITTPILPAANPGCTRLQYNPRFAATGSANSKTVYYNGTWYMAFNETVNNPAGGWTAQDTWRILWAKSTDGQTWAIQPTPLFRSTRESRDCGSGLMMTQLFIDVQPGTGIPYFYILANNLQTDWMTLLRAPINQAYQWGYAGGSWQIATDVPSYRWTWSPTPADGSLELDAGYPGFLNPAYVMPSVAGGVKQGAIARVFTNSAPSSASRLVGITVGYRGYPIYGQVLELWSGPDLEGSGFGTAPESTIDLTRLFPPGLNGFEFGFTSFPDNAAATPRIVGNEFDVWFIGNLSSISPPGQSVNINNLVGYRTTATLSGGVYSKRIALRTYYGYYLSAANGGGAALSAVPTTVGANETLTIVDQNGGTLNDGDPVSLQVANGMYVVAEGGGCPTCTVNANRDGAAQWETFTIKKMNGTGAINNGDSVAFQSYYGYWIVAEGGGGGVVNVNRTSPAQWETFTFTEQP